MTTAGKGVLVGLVALFTLAPTSPAWAALQVASSAAGNTLSWDGVSFHTTPNAVLQTSVLPLPGSSGVAVLWTEALEDGGNANYYVVSLDGREFSRVFPRTGRIELRYASFDPLMDVPEVPAELAADFTNRMYIVQFHIQQLEAYQDMLRSLGATIHAYLPEFAVIAEMTPDVQAVVAQLPFVRWVGAVHPAYKLDESILAAWAAGVDDGVARDYSVMVFGRGMEPQNAVIDLIKAMGGRVMNTAPDGFRMTVTLTLPQVLEVARLSEVQFIDPWGRARPTSTSCGRSAASRTCTRWASRGRACAARSSTRA